MKTWWYRHFIPGVFGGGGHEFDELHSDDAFVRWMVDHIPEINGRKLWGQPERYWLESGRGARAPERDNKFFCWVHASWREHDHQSILVRELGADIAEAIADENEPRWPAERVLVICLRSEGTSLRDRCTDD